MAPPNPAQRPPNTIRRGIQPQRPHLQSRKSSLGGVPIEGPDPAEGELCSMCWSIAKTKMPGDRVRRDFSSLDIEHYCPLERSIQIVRGRKVETARPLFPGYAFFVVPPSWERIFKLPSIFGLFLCNGEPLCVRDDEMEIIRKTENEKAIVRRRFRNGQPVRAKAEHPFGGCVGIVDRSIDRERVVVLFDIFGRKTPATIAEGELTVA